MTVTTNISESNTLAEAAVAYAMAGFSVIQLRRASKRPVDTWAAAQEKGASPDDVGRAWQVPGRGDCNVGVVTGEVSSVFVLDFDGNDVEWQALRARGLPDTARVVTARGCHLYYRWPGFRVKSTVKLLAGMDISGDGGYVVAPPSIHPGGQRYRWAGDVIPTRHEIPDAPEWLIELLGCERPETPIAPAAADDSVSRHELSQATRAFVTDGAPEGERNARLFKAACDYAGSGYPIEEAESALIEAAVHCGLPSEEARRTLASAYDKPRSPARPRVTADEEASGGRDYDVARTLSRLVTDRICWAAHRRVWMEYDGCVWEPIGESNAAVIATEALRDHYAAQKRAGGNSSILDNLSKIVGSWPRISATLKFLRGMPGYCTRAEEWDADLDALNIDNGLFDLRSFTLREHRPSDRCSLLAPVTFDESARSPEWASHLGLFLPDVDVQRELQRHIGRALSGYAMAERLPIWYGTGRNGKTTTTRAIMDCLGTYARKAAPDLLLVTKNEQHPTAIADLAGSRVVFSVEADQARRLHESTIKELTGGDTKKARFMRADFFEFAQTFDITLVVNHHPTIHGTDTGIWRRIRLIPWAVSLSPENCLPQDDVLRGLSETRSGLFNWTLAGLYDFYEHPTWSSEEVDAATDDYRQDQDILAEFMQTACTLGEGLAVGVGELYAEYIEWAERDGQKPVQKRTFGDKLRGRGFQQGKSSGVRRWLGLTLS